MDAVFRRTYALGLKKTKIIEQNYSKVDFKNWHFYSFQAELFKNVNCLIGIIDSDNSVI